MSEIRELIAFYDERGWDWRAAACYTLIRQLYGSYRDFADAHNPIRRRKS